MKDKDLVIDEMLTTGIEEIDDDHGKLANLFNTLNHSVIEGASTDYIGAILDELIKCTIWHFSHEERLMVKYAYPAMDEHKEEHEDLINSVREFQQKFIQTGKLDEKDLAFLERWLTEHILVADQRLGAYLVEAM